MARAWYAHPLFSRLVVALACLLSLEGCTAAAIAKRGDARPGESTPASGAAFPFPTPWLREREPDEFDLEMDAYHDDGYDEDDVFDEEDEDAADSGRWRRRDSDEAEISPPREQTVEPDKAIDKQAPAVESKTKGKQEQSVSPEKPGRADAETGKAQPDKKPDEPKPPRKPGLMDDLTMGMMAISLEDFETPPQETPLSLQHVAASVLRNNRTIQVAAYRPEQARAGVMQAKSVYDPELFGSWNHSRTEAPAPVIISGVPTPNRDFRNEVGQAGFRQHLPSGGEMRVYHEWNSGIERNPGNQKDRGHGSAYVVELSQPILNGFADAENRALIEISRIQVDISEEELRQTIIETMTKAMVAYWEVAQAREEVRINKESLEMAERLLEREIGRKDEGISTQLDVDRAREAVSTRAYNLMLAREQQRTAQENLKYLINDKNIPMDMDVYVDAVESIESPLVRINMDKAIDTALKNRPEMLNADLAIRSGEVRRQYAKHSLLPELNVIGQVRHNDKNNTTPTTGSSTLYTGTDWTVGLEFSMPIGNMKARANLRQAESEVSQKVEEKKNARDYIISEVKTVVKNMELVVREIPLNRRAMEAARKVLEGEWARLELNQIGNRDLLQAQDLVSVTERNFITSQIRYNVHIINLYAAQGTLLEKMGISLRK